MTYTLKQELYSNQLDKKLLLIDLKYKKEEIKAIDKYIKQLKKGIKKEK